ncbi:MAG: DNA-binding protein WhiA [Roseburia sp.]|nr:DNA-binding protein WhiA [Ruminococcus sp.]MCM1155808.1 DNA-binding protein WhiA [Roseburia sp.]MCM1241958.1 DNA-binding protein WhiA [Roseburia sp.]
MSFSQTVKDELAAYISPARHCQLAELAALIHFGGHRSSDGLHLDLDIENEMVARKCFTLLQKTFNIDNVMREVEEEKILQALHLYDAGHHILSLDMPVNALLIKNSCCARAYLRGVFLCAGSMSDPEKSYHLEFVCGRSEQAEQLRRIIREFQIEARVIRRKKYYIVYLKEGSGIVDLLNVMGAHVSLMNLENLRIVKEMRNSINRRVNCEAANITKTVNAASKQIEDILLIQKQYGFENLPDNLRQMAEVRLEYPEAPLKELGEYLDPPVGKSGVNHRLRKLSEIAEHMRL